MTIRCFCSCALYELRSLITHICAIRLYIPQISKLEHNKLIFSKVPTLRFAKFAEQWEQKTFDETFSILLNNTLSRAELNYENGNYKNIHYGDVLIKFSAFIDVSSPDVPYINDENSSSKLDNLLLQDGDIIIADTAEDFTVGKATEVENIDAIKVVSGLHSIPYRPKIKFSPRYLGYYVNAPAYHNQLIPFIQGVKVSSISKTLIKKTFVSFPSLSEQTRIADFLSCLDKKIETQNKIIKHRKSLIISLVIEIFLSFLSLIESVLSFNFFSFFNNLLKLLWTIFKEVSKKYFYAERQC